MYSMIEELWINTSTVWFVLVWVVGKDWSWEVWGDSFVQSDWDVPRICCPSLLTPSNLLADCAPSWNIEPSDPLYVLENQEASFHWQYDSGGFSLQEIKWKVTTTGGTIIMASESNVGNFATNPSYSGNTRVTRSNTGNAAINLRDVKISDNGQYECDVDFGGFNAINHRTNLVVVGKCSWTNFFQNIETERRATSGDAS